MEGKVSGLDSGKKSMCMGFEKGHERQDGFARINILRQEKFLIEVEKVRGRI